MLNAASHAVSIKPSRGQIQCGLSQACLSAGKKTAQASRGHSHTFWQWELCTHKYALITGMVCFFFPLKSELGGFCAGILTAPITPNTSVTTPIAASPARQLPELSSASAEGSEGQPGPDASHAKRELQFAVAGTFRGGTASSAQRGAQQSEISQAVLPTLPVIQAILSIWQAPTNALSCLCRCH